MIKKETTIAGKNIMLAYCYATEIAFKDLAGIDINDFMKDVQSSISKDIMPDVKYIIFLIFSAITAYYNSQNKKSPVSITELMSEITPPELGIALGTFLTVRAQFYDIPIGEPIKPNDGKDSEKN